MAEFKKHAAIPAFVAAIALLIAIAVQTYGMRDNGTFALKDLTGSRDAIGDVAIGGELLDGYHRTNFRLQAGTVTTHTAIFEQPRSADMYTYNPGMAKRIDDMQFNVSGIGTYEITSYKLTNPDAYFIPVGSAEVTPAISNGKTNSATFANQPEYGVAKVGDKVYFTVPVSAEFTGKSGIYELRFHQWGLPPAVDRKQYAARKVAEINLDANASPEQPHIEVLGLEAVGAKLILLSVEGPTLKISSYDSDSGKLLGEASVPDFYLPGRPGEKPAGTNGYVENYEAYADPAQDMLNVSFRGSEGRRLILSFDVSRGVQVVNTVQADLAEGANLGYGDTNYMSYRNGKLYVLRNIHEARTSDASPMYDLALPQHFYIYVYAQSKLVYRGELLTDRNEDNMEMIYGQASRGGFSYDSMDYRRFANLSVASIPAAGGTEHD
ncbi:hypothetical protein [Cohnella nanjingensis]|uniref:Uncharacterized protein n=1 Tax=Cohnella nanjingensis TaxID=1387779 RepID=A0A7X0VGL5_9BACL|nr:hypothetical protein [Cohnella nanjingensis]MBB6672971.1 hypothetical protein [Cohnella nanjingensis]